MAGKSVFVSSVMRGFAVERGAARQAVETLRHHAIMAEDFGAKPESPQSACLAEVGKSDIYVGVFGSNYGTPAKSGISPTEEEFREAERLGKDVLCFVFKGKREKRQEEFITSLKPYEDGRMLAFYETSEELFTAIIKGLNDLQHRTPHGKQLDEQKASEKMRMVCGSGCGASSRDTQATFMLFATPELENANWLGSQEFNDPKLRRKLEQQLVYGDVPCLFRSELGVRLEEEESAFCFLQARGEGSFLALHRRLRVCRDGTIVLEANIMREKPKHGMGLDFAYATLIHEPDVLEATISYLTFIDFAYSHILQCGKLQRLFFGTQFTGLKNKMLGRPAAASSRTTRVPMSMSDIREPLVVPDRPFLVGREQLRERESLTQDLFDRIQRRFKSVSAYYEPG